jgi:hypothetical protein
MQRQGISACFAGRLFETAGLDRSSDRAREVRANPELGGSDPRAFKTRLRSLVRSRRPFRQTVIPHAQRSDNNRHSVKSSGSASRLSSVRNTKTLRRSEAKGEIDGLKSVPSWEDKFRLPQPLMTRVEVIVRQSRASTFGIRPSIPDSASNVVAELSESCVFP